MKKSIVVADEAFLLDLSGSTQTIRAPRATRPSTIKRKSSRLFVSGVNYPGAEFIAKKLKRIIVHNLLSVFLKLRSHKKIIINLNLLSSVGKRFQ